MTSEKNLKEEIKHETRLVRNFGGGPKFLGICCTCGWRGGYPGQRESSLQRLAEEHLNQNLPSENFIESTASSGLA
jgi:hypothetical protein